MLELFLVTFMLNEKIDEMLLEIKEYEKYFLFEVSGTYVNLLLEPHNTSVCRKELLKFCKEGMRYSKLEKEILNIIKKSTQSEKGLAICEEIISDLDRIHFNVFNYNEWILDEFEKLLDTKKFKTSVMKEKEFEVLDEESKEELIKKLSKNGG